MKFIVATEKKVIKNNFFLGGGDLQADFWRKSKKLHFNVVYCRQFPHDCVPHKPNNFSTNGAVLFILMNNFVLKSTH